MALPDHLQDILTVFFTPTVIIFLLRVGSQIHKTAFSAAQAGHFLSHHLFFISLK